MKLFFRNLVIAFFSASLLISAAFAQDSERVIQGNLVMENIPEIPNSVKERLRQYSSIRSARLAGFAPDRGLYIATQFGEVTQIHHVAQPLGMRRQVTFYDEPVGGANVQPGGSGLFQFAKDTGGDEYYQGFLFDPDSGQASVFTEAGSRNGSFLWSDDGSQIAWYRSTQGDPDWDIMVSDPTEPQTTRVALEGEGAIFPVDWSADGTRILFTRFYSVTHSDLFVMEVESGAVTEVNPDVDVAYNGAVFSGDGNSIYVGTDEGSDFRNIMEIDLFTGEKRTLTDNLSWDIEDLDLSPDGSILAFTTNEHGVSRLQLMDTTTEEYLSVPDLGINSVQALQFGPAGERLGLTLNSAQSPGDVWVYHFESGDLIRWTHSEVGGLNTDRFVSPELITFESFDGLEIPAFVYKPDSTGPFPVVISIHGGPEGQFRPGFSSKDQYWINELGAAVIAPNVRGSSGYGREYVSLDNGYNRENSVRDIGALLDWIAQQPDLDESRVVVYGGSYGGYMVLASAVHYSDRLAGAVDIVGISNFVTFLENTSGYRRDLRRVEYGDERDPEMRAHLEAISPSNNVDQIEVPIFIIQGANDPRVPASESEQMLQAIRENGGEVWYLLALDEGHGFRKKSNREIQTAAETLFIEEVFDR